MSDASTGSAALGIAGITDAAEIGAGGFGIVYRATEADLGRTVAVKVLTGNLDEGARYRFERERRAMGRLSGHPNIVTVYRGGYTDAGNAYLVMEYLDRGSLADRLANAGPLGWEDALTFGVQLSGALETSHRAGVLHRDIKPGNILLSRLGNAKLCDFGIARLQGALETKSSVVTASLSHAPPDIVMGQRPDARSDVYSLASTLYELVTGMPPFVRPTDESMVPILARIAQDPVPPLPATQLPEPVFDAISHAMAKDPDDRPATAVAFGQLLVQAQQQLGLAPTPIPIEAVSPEGGSGSAPAASIPFPDVPSGSLPAPSASSPGTATGPAADAGPADRAAATAISGPLPAPSAQSPGAADATIISAPREVPDATGWAPPKVPDGPSADTPSPGHGDPGRPPWLVPAVVGAAVLVAAIVGGVLLLSGGDDGDDVSATGTSDVDSATATAGGSEDDGDDPITTIYQMISDVTGTISVSVPVDWTDTYVELGSNDLPQLSAAPNLEGGLIDSYDGPGVLIAAQTYSDEAEIDFDVALDRVADGNCTSEGRESVTLPYLGKLERFSACGGTDTRLVHVVYIDRATNVTAIMRVQITSDRDAEAADTIRRSLQLVDNVPR